MSAEHTELCRKKSLVLHIAPYFFTITLFFNFLSPAGHSSIIQAGHISGKESSSCGHDVG
jgi:hypothetical protein